MKTLIDKLKKVGKGFKRGVLIVGAVASLGVASCKLCPDPEPNYAPVASLYVNPTSVKTNENIYIQLNGTDENGNDDIVEYKVYVDKGADGTIEETITSPNPINQSWSSDYVGNVKIQGKVTDSQGAVGKATPITINVYSFPTQDYVDISGRLEDCENDGTARQGIIRVYDALDNSLIGSEHLVNGNFSITLDKLVSELSDGVVIKAISTNSSGVQNSYVRTKTFPAGDVSVNSIRVVPYPDFDTDGDLDVDVVDYQRFKDFMSDINIPNGISKFDLDGFVGIKIFKNNRGGSSAGSFFDPGSSDSKSIRTRIQNNNIFGWFNGESVPIEVVEGNAPDEIPLTGWIFIEPYNLLNGSTRGETIHYPVGSLFSNSALIKLVSNPSSSSYSPYDYVIAHEFGHASEVAYDEANDFGHLTFPLTTMEYPSSPPTGTVTPGFADIKAAKIIHESTYSLGEFLNNILGTTF